MSKNKAISEAAHLRRAAILEERGDYDKAIASMMKALSAQSNNPESWSRLGDLYRSLEQWDLAVDAYKKSLELRTDNHTAQEALLQTYLEAGRYDDAIANSKLVLKRHAKNVYARDIMGVAYLQTGMIDEAIRVTDELIRLEPTDATNHFKKAVLLQQKGEVGMAVREFTRVLEMAPESGIADQAGQAVSTLESFQLRQIVSLAAEDNIFRTKLARDPESAAFEKGFFLSYTGLNALRQISFDTLPESGADSPQKYYHYH